MAGQVLLGDLSSSSYLKLALARSGERPGVSTRFSCRSLEDLDASIESFLSTYDHPELSGAAFSACGWENHGGLTMPNDDYTVERAWLKERLDVKRINLVNNCVSMGLALERLKSDEQFQIYAGQSDPMQTRALIGISSGLGTVALINDDLNHIVAMPCEGGHSDLPATNAKEQAVLELMIKKYGHVSRERAVSLLGLQEVWRCLNLLNGGEERSPAAEEVVAMACADDPLALETINMVIGFLASTASDMALFCGARGGVYLGGEFFDLLGDLFDYDHFQQRYIDKGRLSHYVGDIPVFLIKTPEPELIGLSTLFS